MFQVSSRQNLHLYKVIFAFARRTVCTHTRTQSVVVFVRHAYRWRKKGADIKRKTGQKIASVGQRAISIDGTKQRPRKTAAHLVW